MSRVWCLVSGVLCLVSGVCCHDFYSQPLVLIHPGFSLDKHTSIPGTAGLIGIRETPKEGLSCLIASSQSYVLCLPLQAPCLALND